MSHRRLLTLASLLSIVLLTFHLADDIVRGFEKGGIPNLVAIPIVVLWLYATLGLAGRRAGYAILLLGSALGAFVPYVHFRAAGGVAHGAIATSGGALFFVWTLIAIGVTSVSGFLLAAHGLWRSLSSRAPS